MSKFPFNGPITVIQIYYFNHLRPISTYVESSTNHLTGIYVSETSHWRRSGVFTVNFEHISHLVLVFLLLTLPAG